MKTITVKDLMVQLSEYATIPEEASLMDAILALEKAQVEFNRSRYLHRAVLVYDKMNNIVGKLGQIDIIRALEPKYEEIADFKHQSFSAFSPGFFKSMFEHLDLWSKPLTDICRTMTLRKIKDVMYKPEKEEYVPAETTLDEAIHRFIMGSHQSLLVMEQNRIVGILRLTDVFHKISEIAKTCKF